MRDFVADYAALIAAFETRLPKPWVAMGHSMGGCLTALVLAKGEDRFAAAVLSAPMFGYPHAAAGAGAWCVWWPARSPASGSAALWWRAPSCTRRPRRSTTTS